MTCPKAKWLGQQRGRYVWSGAFDKLTKLDKLRVRQTPTLPRKLWSGSCGDDDEGGLEPAAAPARRDRPDLALPDNLNDPDATRANDDSSVLWVLVLFQTIASNRVNSFQWFNSIPLLIIQRCGFTDDT